MIKIVFSILLFGFLINLSGCSSSARPQFIRGGYFLTGDDDCWSSSRRTYNTINCYNKKDELVGYREEMTDEELQEYRYKQSKSTANAESWRQLNQSLDNLNQSLQQQGNSLKQLNSQTYRQPSFNYNNNQNTGTPIYNSDECIGAVVNGKCSGTINPNPSNVLRKKCYGIMINGECQGAIGY